MRELESSPWVSSFKRVNIHPGVRTDFPTWCKRIGSFLEGGQSFNTEDELDVYALFSSFWRVRPMQRARTSFLSNTHMV